MGGVGWVVGYVGGWVVGGVGRWVGLGMDGCGRTKLTNSSAAAGCRSATINRLMSASVTDGDGVQRRRHTAIVTTDRPPASVANNGRGAAAAGAGADAG